MSFVDAILRHVPMPARLQPMLPGFSISGNAIRFIELRPTKEGIRVGRHGYEPLPSGIVEEGMIQQRERLVEMLSVIRRRNRLASARLSVPHTLGALVELVIPMLPPHELRAHIRSQIDGKTPFDPMQATIDFDFLNHSSTDNSRAVVVSVLPRVVAEEYISIFREAGLELASLEFDVQAAARSAVLHTSEGILLVCVENNDMDMAVIGDGVVRRARTVEFESSTELANLSDVYPWDIHHSGRVPEPWEYLVKEYSVHIEHEYIDWEKYISTQRTSFPRHSIKQIVLAGTQAAIPGFAEHVARTLRVPTTRANVWSNVFSLNDYIPPIPYIESFSYTSAIGSALRRDA